MSNRDERMARLWDDYFNGDEAMSDDARFLLTGMGHTQALESFKAIDLDRASIAGGKKSAATRQQQLETLGRDWLDAARELLEEEPTLSINAMAKAIKEETQEGAPTRSLRTISAHLAKHLER